MVKPTFDENAWTLETWNLWTKDCQKMKLKKKKEWFMIWSLLFSMLFFALATLGLLAALREPSRAVDKEQFLNGGGKIFISMVVKE